MCWAVRSSTRPSAPLNGWSNFHYSKHLLLSRQTAFAARSNSCLNVLLSAKGTWGYSNSCKAPTACDWFLMTVLPWYRGKTNFFEKRVGDYQKSGVMAGLNNTNQHTIAFDEDF